MAASQALQRLKLIQAGLLSADQCPIGMPDMLSNLCTRFDEAF